MIEDPIPSYRFFVTLNPADAYLRPEQAALVPVMALAAFQEVRGLGAELEVMPYAEGGVNDHVHQLPVRHTWNRIVLRRGLVREPGLYQWYLAGLFGSLGARRDGSVVLTTPLGVPAVGWTFRGGLAAKWQGPELVGAQNAVAVESLEIAHEGILQIAMSPPLIA
jgi:phage tail-like protein